MKTKRRQIPKKNRELIINRDGRKCFYCGSTERLTVDHIVPLKHGGSNLASNMITSCHSCNSTKNGNRLLHIFESSVLNNAYAANIEYGIPQDMDVTYYSEKQNKRSGQKRRPSTAKRKNYSEMTREEKIEKCLRANSNHWRCGIISGDVVCPKCASVAINKKVNSSITRIKKYTRLFVARTHKIRDFQRLSRRDDNFFYLSFPYSDNGERIVIMNKKSFGYGEEVSREKAIEIIRYSVENYGKYGNVSGNM